MKIRELKLILSKFDPDASIGVQCVEGDESWINTDIAIESNGIGVGAEIAIVRTDSGAPDGAFRAPGACP